MTEAEWLASSNPQAMLVAVQEKASNRKLRLFACASARLRPDYRLNEPSWVKSVRIAEAVADGSPMPDDRPRTMVGTDLGPTSAIAIHAARTLCSYVSSLCKPEAHFLRDIVGNPFRPVTLPHGPLCQTCHGCGELGTLAGKQTCYTCGTTPLERGSGRLPCPWLNSTVVSLAQAAYEERNPTSGHLDPVRLAVLADALEEAGCPVAIKCQRCNGLGFVTGVKNGVGWEWCDECDESNRLPHPLLAHLRSPGPHVRGCWAIDLVLERE